MRRDLGILACVLLLCSACALWVWAAAPTGSPVLHSAPDTALVPTFISDLLRLRERASDPSTPPSTQWHLYTKDGGIFLQDDTGLVIQLGVGGGGSGDVDLQTAYETGVTGGWTDVPAARKLTFAPLGMTGPVETRWGESGNIVTRCANGTTGAPCNPPDVYLDTDLTWRVRAKMGTTPPYTDIDVLTIENDGGTGLVFSDRGTYANLPTASYTNQRYLVTDCLTDSCVAGGGSIMRWKLWNSSAWVNEGPQTFHLPWNAAGAWVDGTNCVKADTQINSGPNIAGAIVCADAAGSIEFSFDTPERYNGGALQICYEVLDTTSSSQVWEASVQAQFRGSGAVTNNTWTTAAADASVTMTTAHANYYACSSLTPSSAAAGVGRVYVKATIDAASGHTDSSARVLGGYVTGLLR